MMFHKLFQRKASALEGQKWEQGDKMLLEITHLKKLANI